MEEAELLPLEKGISVPGVVELAELLAEQFLEHSSLAGHMLRVFLESYGDYFFSQRSNIKFSCHSTSTYLLSKKDLLSPIV